MEPSQSTGNWDQAYSKVSMNRASRMSSPSRGVSVRAKVPVPVHYHSLQLETGFRADLIVNESLLLELKAVEFVLPVHKAQIITYLKLTLLPLGLLINFTVPLLKDGLHRFLHPSLLRNS